MTVLLITAGILAAIILFRWARLLAMVFLVVTAVYFMQRFDAWEATQLPRIEMGR